MTYEKNDSYTGAPSGVLRIKKSVVDDVMYPPDYFFKKAAAAIKKVGDKIGDTKVATAIRNTKAYQNVAKPILKVAVPVAAAVGLGVAGAAGVKALQAKKAANAVKAVDAKLSASPSVVTSVTKPSTASLTAGLKPSTNIVSSVTGAKGTPVITSGAGTFREGLISQAGKIKDLAKSTAREKGNELLSKGLDQLRTSAEMLPKTREMKEAEELFLSPSEETQGQTLQAGGFSISPMLIVGVLLVVVVLGFVAKK